MVPRLSQIDRVLRMVTTHMNIYESALVEAINQIREEAYYLVYMAHVERSKDHVLCIRCCSSKSWKLETKAWNGWRDRDHWFRPWRDVAGVVNWWRRSVVNLSILRAMLNVASTTASVKASASTTARGVCGDASANGCPSISTCLKSERTCRTLRRHTSADLNVGLFQDHATLKCPAAGAAMFRRQRPFAVSIGKP
jgi:hypothetical protein